MLQGSYGLLCINSVLLKIRRNIAERRKMIVCLCKGLNEKKVIRSVRHMLDTNASDEMIYHMMAFQCGKCMETVQEIIDDLRHLENI